MGSEKLLPCPFDCDPEVDPTVESTVSGWFNVTCNWCGATGPTHATADEAADGWNERVHHD